MRLSPDQMIFWQHGFLKLNGTIVFTWGLMLVLAVGSKLITRKLSTDLKRSRWQNLLEIVIGENPLRDEGACPQDSDSLIHHSQTPSGSILNQSALLFIYSRHPFPYQAKDLIRDGLNPFAHLLGSDLFPTLPAHQDHFIAKGNSGNTRDIRYNIIHAHSSYNRSSSPADKDLSLIR